MEKGNIFTVEISGYTSEGAGIARIDGRAVFVPLAMRGETCEIKILKVLKNLAYAKLLRVISASPARVESECEYFPKCGGCDLWHMTYEEELSFKENKVRDAITRIAGLNIEINPILGSERTVRYRNKAQFPVGNEGGKVASGFYRPHSHDIVPSENCIIQSEAADTIRRAVMKWQEDFSVPSYDEETCRGVVRHIYVRNGEKGAMLCLVAARRPKYLDELCEYVKRAYPDICGITININNEKTNVILGDRYETVCGTPYMEDKLSDLRFRISPAAFYQVNRDQAERLYSLAIDYIKESGAETALDLYCGIGTITLCMAKHLRRVIGIEVVEKAIEDARENAKLNGIENAEFFCADVGEAMKLPGICDERPDAVLVDPPRKGLSPVALSWIKNLGAKTLVYVSCDPATLARDLGLLCGDGTYTAVSATPVDMFPRTKHVECVVRLSGK